MLLVMHPRIPSAFLATRGSFAEERGLCKVKPSYVISDLIPSGCCMLEKKHPKTSRQSSWGRKQTNAALGRRLLFPLLTRGLPGCSPSARRKRRAEDGCAGCRPASAGGWVAASPRRCSAAPPRSARLPPAPETGSSVSEIETPAILLRGFLKIFFSDLTNLNQTQFPRVLFFLSCQR